MDRYTSYVSINLKNGSLEPEMCINHKFMDNLTKFIIIPNKTLNVNLHINKIKLDEITAKILGTIEYLIYTYKYDMKIKEE